MLLHDATNAYRLGLLRSGWGLGPKGEIEPWLLSWSLAAYHESWNNSGECLCLWLRSVDAKELAGKWCMMQLLNFSDLSLISSLGPKEVQLECF